MFSIRTHSLSLVGLALSLLISACGSSPPKTSEPMAAEPAMAAPAAAPPAPAPAPTAEAAPAPAAEAAKPAMPQVAATPEEKLGTAAAGLGLKVGDKAPDATLPDVTGAMVKLSALYAKGPTFVIFYRGGWCPFCNSQLHNLTEAKAEFDKRGVQLVAISVDKPSEEAKTQAKLGVPFPMLSDSKLTVQSAFKIVHKTGAEEQAALAGYGVDLQAYSGETHKNFATASLFYIDRGGVIRFVHVDEDYKTRPSPAQMLAVADRLAKK
jgi:peroxiredoxin